MREYSDALLIFLLKGLRPGKYRERVELKGSLAKLNLELLPDALIERMARGEHPLSVLASATPELRAEALGLPPARRGARMTTGKGSDDG